MQFQLPDMGPVIPELVLAGLAMAILLSDFFIKRKDILAFLSIVSVAIVGYTLIGSAGTTFGGMFISDGYSRFFKLIFLLNLFLTILISVRYIAIEKINFGEYYSLILFSTLGMMIMASAGDFILLFLGLELMVMSTYVLAGFIRHDVRSNEAAIKYFLLGAFSSGILLYGISLIYGLTGTTDIRAIGDYVSKNGLEGNPMLLLSMILLAVAFGFKVAAAPFHMWAPDAYEGAPTSITAFMSVGAKAAGFAVLGRVFMIALANIKVEWAAVLIPLSIFSMIVGNIAAIAQTNIKRMLAYSSIGHAGYALLGVISASNEGLAGMMNYMMIYAFMNIGAFTIVIMLRNEGFKGEDITDYEGLAKTHPLLAAVMMVFMFSLTGIPPTAGFIAKFYVFMSAINAGYTWLVVIAVIFSAISAYYYLRIVMYMYMKEPKTEVRLATFPGINITLLVTVIAILWIGIFPSFLVDLAKAAVSGF